MKLLTAFSLCFPLVLVAQPKVQVENSVLNFGTVHVDKGVKKSFIIKNVGTEDLIIKSFSGAWGTVSERNPGQVLAPGTSTTRWLKPVHHYTQGVYTNIVMLQTNDLETPLMILKGLAEVLPAIDYGPSLYKHAPKCEEDVFEKSFNIRSLNGKTFDLSLREFEKHDVTMTPSPDGTSYAVTAKIPPASTDQSSHLEFETNMEGHEYFIITFSQTAMPVGQPEKLKE